MFTKKSERIEEDKEKRYKMRKKRQTDRKTKWFTTPRSSYVFVSDTDLRNEGSSEVVLFC